MSFVTRDGNNARNRKSRPRNGLDVSFDSNLIKEIFIKIWFQWRLPTDIQSEAIPLILGGGDVLMAAETGSGKTGAFCLPILQIVWETIYRMFGSILIIIGIFWIGVIIIAIFGVFRTESNSNRKRTTESSDQNKWRLNPNDREVNLSLSPDGMSAQSKGDQRWQGCRANNGVKRVLIIWSPSVYHLLKHYSTLFIGPDIEMQSILFWGPFHGSGSGPSRMVSGRR